MSQLKMSPFQKAYASQGSHRNTHGSGTMPTATIRPWTETGAAAVGTSV